jgi:hypothetical protein
MEFPCIKFLCVKLVTFTSAHTMLIIIKISKTFTFIPYVTILLRCILLSYLRSFFYIVVLKGM